MLGSNGSGKSHFRGCCGRGSDPDVEHRPHLPVDSGVAFWTGPARLPVRPAGSCRTTVHPELLGRTLLETLHRGDAHRDGLPREPASRALDRYELAEAAENRFETLSGGQQARFQLLLLELPGATLLLLDEPTDNLDVQSAEALEAGLESFEGTVVAVTHDRWFARGFDRFLVFGATGEVYESTEPVWDEDRCPRPLSTPPSTHPGDGPPVHGLVDGPRTQLAPVPLRPGLDGPPPTSLTKRHAPSPP